MDISNPLESITLAITGCLNKQLLFEAKDERMNSCGNSQPVSVGSSKSNVTGLVGTAAVLGIYQSRSGGGGMQAHMGRVPAYSPLVGNKQCTLHDALIMS